MGSVTNELEESIYANEISTRISDRNETGKFVVPVTGFRPEMDVQISRNNFLCSIDQKFTLFRRRFGVKNIKFSLINPRGIKISEKKKSFAVEKTGIHMKYDL